MSLGYKRYFFQFSFFFIKKIFTKPKIIILLIKILKESFNRKFSKKSTNSESELLSIGVLTDYYRELAKKIGASCVELHTGKISKKIKKKINFIN